MTRIKYKSQPDGRLTSDGILCNTSLALVTLYPKELKYSIVIDGEVVYGTANNLSYLKKKAKTTLKNLGANFKDEIRNRGKTRKFTV